MIGATALLGGCGTAGLDGRDGQDVTIYDIHAATNEARKEAGLPELSFLEFIEEYLNYDDSELKQATSEQAIMNRSLLSGVSIVSEFTETVTPMFRPSYQTVVSYAGSGVIVDIDKEKGDMTVVTNCHVIYDTDNTGDVYASSVYLYLYGTECVETLKIPATIIGASKTYDLAVLKVASSSVVKHSSALAAEWSTDEETYLGATVYAVGNPEGDGMSITAGIVSKDSEYISISLSDSSNTYYPYRVMRTDTAINGGNSGGGLFDTQGRLIGIVNAKSVSEEIDNMGYALPSSTSRRVVQNILDNYNGNLMQGIYRATLGVSTSITNATVTFDKDVYAAVVTEEVYVNSVTSGSKAYSKISAGDIITAISIYSSSGTLKETLPITRQYNVSDIMLDVRSGDTVSLTLLRNDVEVKVEITYSSSDIALYSTQLGVSSNGTVQA
jgi:serine protease Do